MPDEPDAAGFDKSRAELFDALGHPVRIRILHALEAGPLGFSGLRRKVGLESSGHLQFHLGKLNGLIRSGPDGTYSLTDDGREALRIVSAPKGPDSDRSHDDRKVLLSRTILVGLIAAMLLLATVAVIQESEVSGQLSQISSLQSQVSSLQDQLYHYVLPDDVCDKLGNGDCFKVLASFVMENPRFITAENGINYTYYGPGGETSSIINDSLVRTISLIFLYNQTDTELNAVIPLGGGIAGYGGYYDIADMTFFFAPSTLSSPPT
jgi:DNA-binding transcriptional ArsR family regulator